MTLFFQAIISGLSIGAIYALVGVGYNVIFAATRVFNLAQGQILMLGVMFTYALRQEWGLNTVLAVALAAIFAGLVNVLVDRLAVAPLRETGHTFHGIGTLVTTLGASIIIVNLATYHWGAEAQPFFRFFPVRGWNIGGVDHHQAADPDGRRRDPDHRPLPDVHRPDALGHRALRHGRGLRRRGAARGAGRVRAQPRVLPRRGRSPGSAAPSSARSPPPIQTSATPSASRASSPSRSAASAPPPGHSPAGSSSASRRR